MTSEEADQQKPGTSAVVGLFAYCALAGMTRLSKDGDQAPSTRAHVDLAGLADSGYQRFLDFDAYATERGFSIVEAAGQYAGLFDELDQRTRPSNWWERCVKSYVIFGVFGDILNELSERHQIFSGSFNVWDLGQGSWVRHHLAPLTEEDEQLAMRLSLWARRVAGETFGLARATLFTYPELAIDPESADAIFEAATRRYRERLEDVNLKP
ncbi:ferritin-like fold-containing protein [Actinomyces minihominis]|uniref:ferritin-like fold-containing protein n=1 Tax=Actinomyces minihominis TaxID=2002838 RepID=UPI000C07A5CE|nr:ferritin-like fold-containing protein [Actinomyces minihominis]